LGERNPAGPNDPQSRLQIGVPMKLADGLKKPAGIMLHAKHVKRAKIAMALGAAFRHCMRRRIEVP